MSNSKFAKFNHRFFADCCEKEIEQVVVGKVEAFRQFDEDCNFTQIVDKNNNHFYIYMDKLGKELADKWNGKTVEATGNTSNQGKQKWLRLKEFKSLNYNPPVFSSQEEMAPILEAPNEFYNRSEGPPLLY